MEFVKQCHLCQSQQIRLLFEQKDLFIHTERLFCVRQCMGCGLVFLSPRPTADELLEYYPDSYVAYTPPLQTTKSFLSRMDRRYGLRKRVKFVERFVRRGRILDIGCATGAFLEEVQASTKGPWVLHGVEPNPRAAEVARRATRSEIYAGMLEEAAYPHHYFDVITMWDVLEHVFKPKETLLEIKRILKPEGVLIFSLPNLDSWDAAIFRRYWVGYDVPRHMHVFDLASLRRLLNTTGFEVMEVRCLAGSYFYFFSSLLFFLRANYPNSWLERFASRTQRCTPLRLLTAPYFFLADLLRKSTTITLTCERQK